MGSVHSLIGTVGLAESWSNDTPSSPSTTPGANSGQSAAGPAPNDTSTIPVLSKVEELKGTNPSEFQQVVSDAVTKLKVEARQTSDPFAASYLWNLANRFQLALDSGDESPLDTAPPSSGSGPQAA